MSLTDVSNTRDSFLKVFDANKNVVTLRGFGQYALSFLIRAERKRERRRRETENYLPTYKHSLAKVNDSDFTIEEPYKEIPAFSLSPTASYSHNRESCSLIISHYYPVGCVQNPWSSYNANEKAEWRSNIQPQLSFSMDVQLI